MVTPTEVRPSLSTNRGLQLPTRVVVRTLWQTRLSLMFTTCAFTGLGIATALLLTPEFRSEARIMPEMSSGSGDILKRLASVAGFTGVTLSDAEDTDAVRPDLYPNVLQSTPFILYLIDQPIITTEGHRKTVGQLLLPSTNGWLSTWLLAFGERNETKLLPTNKPGTVRLSRQQQELAEAIDERVTARFDTRSGIITITATMPDANAAATVAQLAMNYLTQYVTDYRTEKARQDLHFYQGQLVDARKRYQTAQFNVFRYNDRHKNVVILATTMDRERMEAELTIAQTVYTELSREFEQAKLKVQARTPLFKVLEPPKVPLKRASPKRILVVILFAGAGLLLSSLFVLAQKANVAEQFRTMIAND